MVIVKYRFSSFSFHLRKSNYFGLVSSIILGDHVRNLSVDCTWSVIPSRARISSYEREAPK